MNEIRNALNEEVLDVMASVKNLEVGSEEYMNTVRAVCTMTDTIEKMNVDEQKLELEKQAEARENRNFIVNCAIGVGTTVVTGIAGIRFKKWIIDKEYKFEGAENLIHSSAIGRNCINKIIGDVFKK